MGKTLHDREAKKDAAYFRKLRHSRELHIDLDNDYKEPITKKPRREYVPETYAD
jgi:hypothetical protein